MSVEMPDHDDVANVFVELAALYPPSELHGYFVGQLVHGIALDEDDLRGQVRQLLDCEAIGPEQWQLLMAVQRAAAEQLTGDISAMTLLLPDEDIDLGQRVAAVGSWCQGFLTGFAVAGKARLEREGAQSYPEAVSEILSDIAAISQAGFDNEESEAAEQQYREIVAYLEMAAVTTFVECCSRGAPTVETAPKLH